MVANLSLSLLRQWYSSQHFDNSIIVDHNRHKRRQTFGSVVKTQVQTSGNRWKSLRCCYSFLGLHWHKHCHTLVLQSRCLESTLRDKHSSVFNYIHVQLHRDFFQAVSPTFFSSEQSSRTRESNSFSRYNTIQKDSVQCSVVAVSIVVSLFAVFFVGAVRFPGN